MRSLPAIFKGRSGKEIILIVFLFATYGFTFSQSDTLFSAKKKVICKIIEINDLEIKYKLTDSPGATIYNISKGKIERYVLSNGRSEINSSAEQKILPEVAGGRSTLKLLPFSFFMDHISFTYERVIKLGTNIEVEAGFINNTMLGHGLIYDGTLYDGDPPSYYGFYFKPGIKFIIGEKFSSVGSSPLHPLKGHYIRIDLAFSTVVYPRLYQKDIHGFYNPYQYQEPVKLTSMAYGALLNYGRQFVIGQKLTLDYFIGIGFSFQENESNLKENSWSYGLSESDLKKVTRYGGFYRDSGSGFSGSVGLRLGYIFQDKKKSNDNVK